MSMKHLSGVVHGQIKHIRYRQVVPFHLQRFGVITASRADGTGCGSARHEEQLNRNLSLPFTGRTASGWQIEGKPAGAEAFGFRRVGVCKQPADDIEKSGVSGQI